MQHKSWAAVSLTEFSVPLINPCLISTIDLTNVPDTSASTSEHPTTTIIVHSAPTPAGHPSLCFFEYHLNYYSRLVGGFISQSCWLLWSKPFSQSSSRGVAGKNCLSIPKLVDLSNCWFGRERGCSIKHSICFFSMVLSRPPTLTSSHSLLLWLLSIWK